MMSLKLHYVTLNGEILFELYEKSKIIIIIIIIISIFKENSSIFMMEYMDIVALPPQFVGIEEVMRNLVLLMVYYFST